MVKICKLHNNSSYKQDIISITINKLDTVDVVTVYVMFLQGVGVYVGEFIFSLNASLIV